MDLYTLKVVLGPRGLRLRSELSESTRVVKVKLDASGRTEQRARFWLETEVDPATDEAPDDDSLPAPPVSQEVPGGVV